MPGGLEPICRDGRILLAVAAPAEAKAVASGLGAALAPAIPAWVRADLHPRFDLILTGIGKANAAGAVARTLDPARHRAVLSVGIAGALPRSERPALPIGTVVAATSCVYADEGLQGPDGFIDCAGLGFPLGDFAGSAVPVHAEMLAALRSVADEAGPIATVSTCSGLDALASQVAARTGAVAEAMEGAAVAHVASRLGVPAGELRVISNTTGDRPAQRWDIASAFRMLTAVIGRL